MSSLKSQIRRFIRDTEGATSMMFGVAAIPLLMVVGVAVDMNRINSAQLEMQIVADKAALAAASTKGTISVRKANGERHLESETHFGGGVIATHEVSATLDDATVKINGDVKGTFTQVASLLAGHPVGQTVVPITAKAVNSTEPGYGICVFATDNHANKAIYLYGTGDFNAIGCHLYTNSDAADAITVQGNKDVVSDGMHALGGFTKIGGAGSVTGGFVPADTVLADPFDLEVDDDLYGSDVSYNSNVTLSAKTYRNITIKKGTATFSPGVHFVTGKLTVQAQGKLFGNGVTIVLVGKDAYLDIQSGGVLDITAPRADQLSEAEKQYAGFAVIGHTNDAGEEAENANIIIGGAGTNIRGIVYTPDQDLKITGNSAFNVDSKYSPIVAKTIELGGNGAIGIGLDFNAYGFERPDPLFIDEVTTVRLVE